MKLVVLVNALANKHKEQCNRKMTYSTDFREKVLEFLGRGRTMREAADLFGIAPDTVNRWKQKLKETGSLEDAPRRITFRKLDPEKLRAYVAAHPDAYLKETGEAFGCNESAVRKAFARLRITRKKKRRGSGSRGRSRWRFIWRSWRNARAGPSPMWTRRA